MPTILIVEEDRESLTYLSNLLTQHRYRVIAASRAAEIMAMVRVHQADLVIAGAAIADAEAYAITRMQIPIIFWAARHGQRGSAILMAENFGAECVLSGRTAPQELLNSIAAVLVDKQREPKRLPMAAQT